MPTSEERDAKKKARDERKAAIQAVIDATINAVRPTILPCPFCGDDAIVKVSFMPNTLSQQAEYRIECHCPLAPKTRSFRNINLAVKVWNHRQEATEIKTMPLPELLKMPVDELKMDVDKIMGAPAPAPPASRPDNQGA